MEIIVYECVWTLDTGGCIVIVIIIRIIIIMNN